VLHAKRQCLNTYEIPGCPEHLRERVLSPLESDLDSFIHGMAIDLHTLSAYVHENMCGFVADIDQHLRVLRCLELTDIPFAINSVVESVMQEAVIRGVMYNLHGSRRPAGRVWQLQAPRSYFSMMKQKSLCVHEWRYLALMRIIDPSIQAYADQPTTIDASPETLHYPEDDIVDYCNLSVFFHFFALDRYLK
jgi:hypothetical protein